MAPFHPPPSSNHIHNPTIEKQKSVPEAYMTTQDQDQRDMSAPQVSRPSPIPNPTRAIASSTPNPSTREFVPPSSRASPAPTEKQPMRKPLVDTEEIVQRPVGTLRKPLPGSGRTLWQNLRDSGVSVIANSSNFDSESLNISDGGSVAE